MNAVPTYTKSQSLMMLASRRGRGVSPLLILLVLAVPAVWVTLLLPTTGLAEPWYIIAINTTLASMFLFWRFIVLAGNAFQSVRARPNIRRILAGDYLVHWHYTPQEWQRFAEREYQRDRDISRSFTTLRQAILGSILFSGVVAAMMLAVNTTEAAKPDHKAPYTIDIMLLCITIAFIMPLVITLFQMLNLYLGDRRSDRRRRKQVPDIYMNRQGIYGLPNGYLRLPEGNVKFRSDPNDPAVIEVEVKKILYSRGGRYPTFKVERILLPRNQASDSQNIGPHFW